MSCGAECLFDMMEFNGMNELRGNPGSMKMQACNCCSGGMHFTPSYGVDKNQGNKYSVSANKKSYDIVADKSYFDMPVKSNVYAAALFYMASGYNGQSSYNVVPQKAAAINQLNQNPGIKQDISLEIDNLEALIGSARAKEGLAWIQ